MREFWVKLNYGFFDTTNFNIKIKFKFLLEFSTSPSTSTFNSIRRDRILLSVQTSSDAILTFSTSFDGLSGLNFEVHLGVDGNTRSELYENEILRSSRSTPGILNAGRFEEFEISWQNNVILVLNRGSPILVYIRNDFFTVRFMGVRAK